MSSPGDSFTVQFTTQNPNTGAAQNADSPPTGVLVRNGVDTAIVVTITNPATGVYNASWTIPTSYVAGDEVQIRIAAAVAGVGGTDILWTATLILGPSTSTESPHYTSVTLVRNHKVNGRVVDLTAFTDAELEEAIVLAEKMIEGITNDIFYTLSNQTYSFDGKGLSKIWFPPRVPYKLLELTSTKFIDIVSGDEEILVEDEDFIRYEHYLEMTREYGRSPRERTFGSSSSFYKGQKNIQIVGDWGRTVTPPEIKYVTRVLAIERLKPGSTKISGSDISQASWPDFAISVRGAGEGGHDITGGTTGYPDLDRMLARHINYIDLFMAIPDTKQTYDGWDEGRF